MMVAEKNFVFKTEIWKAKLLFPTEVTLTKCTSNSGLMIRAWPCPTELWQLTASGLALSLDPTPTWPQCATILLVETTGYTGIGYGRGELSGKFPHPNVLGWMIWTSPPVWNSLTCKEPPRFRLKTAEWPGDPRRVGKLLVGEKKTFYRGGAFQVSVVRQKKGNLSSVYCFLLWQFCFQIFCFDYVNLFLWIVKFSLRRSKKKNIVDVRSELFINEKVANFHLDGFKNSIILGSIFVFLVLRSSWEASIHFLKKN